MLISSRSAGGAEPRTIKQYDIDRELIALLFEELDDENYQAYVTGLSWSSRKVYIKHQEMLER